MMFWKRQPAYSERRRRREEASIFGADAQENNRLDLQHFLFRWEFGDDFSAPLRRPHALLDVACGTGRWAREIARRFPHTYVVGFDVNRDQIDRALDYSRQQGETLPENCTFQTGDALQRFPFADGRFSLVMARANSAYVPVPAWPVLLNELLRVTAPDGWIEVRDFGVIRSQSLALTAMTGIFVGLAAQRPIHPGVGPYLRHYFAALPLRTVQIQTRTVRSGPQHPTRGGRLLLADYLMLMERVIPMIVRSGLANEPQWQQLLAQAHHETTQCSTEVELTAAYGRR